MPLHTIVYVIKVNLKSFQSQYPHGAYIATGMYQQGTYEEKKIDCSKFLFRSAPCGYRCTGSRGRISTWTVQLVTAKRSAVHSPKALGMGSLALWLIFLLGYPDSQQNQHSFRLTACGPPKSIVNKIDLGLKHYGILNYI